MEVEGGPSGAGSYPWGVENVGLQRPLTEAANVLVIDYMSDKLYLNSR